MSEVKISNRHYEALVAVAEAARALRITVVISDRPVPLSFEEVRRHVFGWSEVREALKALDEGIGKQ